LDRTALGCAAHCAWVRCWLCAVWTASRLLPPDLQCWRSQGCRTPRPGQHAPCCTRPCQMSLACSAPEVRGASKPAPWSNSAVRDRGAERALTAGCCHLNTATAGCAEGPGKQTRHRLPRTRTAARASAYIL
jgi:hypothetical protein